jgi:hypothetical protein
MTRLRRSVRPVPITGPRHIEITDGQAVPWLRKPVLGPCP